MDSSFNRDNYQTSRDYELLVHKIIEQEMSGVTGVRELEITHDTKIKGLSGYEHQIDVAYRFKIWKTEILVIVECKQYHKKVGVDDLLEFRARIEDIKAHKGVFITTSGFQSGAVEVAKANRIALLVIRGAIREVITDEQEQLPSMDVLCDLEYRAPKKQCQLLMKELCKVYDTTSTGYKSRISADYERYIVNIEHEGAGIILEPNELDFFLLDNTVRRANSILDLFSNSEQDIITWYPDKLLKAIILDELLTPQNIRE
jgi:hypothetical protein